MTDLTCQRCGAKRHARNLCKAHYTKHHRASWSQWRYTDPAPVQARIRLHKDQGRTLVDLATECGVTRNTLAAVLAGRYEHIRADIASKILSARLRPSDTGCVRRVNALRRLGHRVEEISHLAGVSRRTLGAAMDRRHFTDHLARAVADAYEQMSGTPGHSTVTAKRAATAGHAPPAAWEYADIDDPAAVPDLGETTRRSSADLRAEYAWLRGGGRTEEQIAQALGVKPSTLEDRRYRAASTSPQREAAA